MPYVLANCPMEVSILSGPGQGPRGPSKDEGRFTLRDSETDPEEARRSLEAELDAIRRDWHHVLELQPLT